VIHADHRRGGQNRERQQTDTGSPVAATLSPSRFFDERLGVENR
jgi:hypothetical protein